MVADTRTASPAGNEQLDLALKTLDRIACRHWRHGAAGHLERPGISLPQLHLLMLLQGAGPLTVGQLAERLQVSMPSASLMVDRLEEHGLDARTRDADDRRLVHVKLTTKGEDEARDAAGFKREVASTVLARFTPAELQDLLRVLAATERVLDELAAAPTG